jgi:uncharacterized protein YggE
MHKNLMNLTSLLLLAPLLVACGSKASAKSFSPALQADPQPVTRTITVTGSGKAYLEPDIAFILLAQSRFNGNSHHCEKEDREESGS